MTEKEGKAVSIQDPKVEEENHEKRVLKKASSSFLERNVPLLPFFVVPHQRKKRWTDPDPHLHKDWGDIFFDLFFVAAAYNLGNVLREDPTTRGLLYFMACFLPLTAIYQMKVFYDSRFGKSEDFWHFLCDTALYLFLAVAVLNIRTVRVMAQPAVYNDMFAFCLSVSLCFFLSTGRSLEIIFCYRMWPSCRQKPECNKHNNDDTNDNKDEQQGDSNNSQDEADAHNHHDLDHNEKIGLSPCALSSARDDASSLALATIVAIAASIYTGLEYHGSKNDDDSSHRLLAGDSEAAISYLKSSDADDTAAWLLLAACAATILYWAGLALYLKIKEIDFQSTLVPFNTEYIIHRQGEWTLLLLGETVLSLLIVEYRNNVDYYQTFYSGLLSIILLEYLHFQTSPHRAQDHALTRGLSAGVPITLCIIVYSAVLVIMGASYKMFLFEYRYESEYADNETAYDNNRSLLGMALRSLAGDGTSAALRFDTADRQQRIAYFFCISTAVVWACLDIMALIHCGWAAAVEAFQKSRSQLILSLLLMARGSLIVWLATLCLYETHPRTLSLLALAGVSAQLVLRVVTFYVLPRDVESEQTEALGKSLQYTAARLRMPSQH